MPEPTLPPLPEPLLISGMVNEGLNAHECDGYTTAQMLAYGRACREAALEEAAIAAWNHFMDTARLTRIHPSDAERWMATKAIRALKEDHA